MYHEYEQDEWGTVLPTKDTARYIVNQLRLRRSVLLAIGLAEGTMENILFAIPTVGKPANAYRLGGGQVVVAVDRMGTYQFDLANGAFTAPAYIQEKLRIGEADAKPLSDLINLMKEEWRNY